MLKSPEAETSSPSLVEVSQSAPASRAALQIGAIHDLVQYARTHDLALADEFLTDILAKLQGWPVEELNRLA